MKMRVSIWKCEFPCENASWTICFQSMTFLFLLDCFYLFQRIYDEANFHCDWIAQTARYSFKVSKSFSISGIYLEQQTPWNCLFCLKFCWAFKKTRILYGCHLYRFTLIASYLTLFRKFSCYCKTLLICLFHINMSCNDLVIMREALFGKLFTLHDSLLWLRQVRTEIGVCLCDNLLKLNYPSGGIENSKSIDIL